MNEFERQPIGSDLLRTFQTIAECGNLTIAAGKLGRTQSAISVQLRKLEDRLGVCLFDRTSKGMVLTSEGERLLPRAQAIATNLREAAALFAEPLTGSIRVGFPDDDDTFLLERILVRFARAHPGVRVVAWSGCTAGYPDAIAAGALDVAVCSGGDNRIGEDLGVEHAVWAARKGSALHRQTPLPLALLDRTCWWRDLPKARLEAAGRDYDIAFRSSSFSSLQAALRAGLAVGMLPLSSVDDGLQILGRDHGLPDLPSSRRSTLVSARAPSPVAEAMVAAIRDAHANPHRKTGIA